MRAADLTEMLNGVKPINGEGISGIVPSMKIVHIGVANRGRVLGVPPPHFEDASGNKNYSFVLRTFQTRGLTR